MRNPEFEATYAALISDLSAIVVLLRGHSQDFWAVRLEECRTGLQAGDYYALGRLLESFGGMGSLNDVVLPDHDPADPSGRMSEADHELRVFCNRIYDQAAFLQGEWGNDA